MVGVQEIGRWNFPSRPSPTSKDHGHKQLSIHVISDGITRLPVLEGEISHIELPRSTDTALGLTIVGGADTPLRCVVVQEVFQDGLVALDGRLQPGDQVVEVNGVDMTTASHHQVCEALRKTCSVLRLGVYREKIEAYRTYPSLNKESPIEPGDIHGVHTYTNGELVTLTLCKDNNKPLGITFGSIRSEPGIFVTDILPGSVAAQDGRLHLYDKLVSLDGTDFQHLRPEYASMALYDVADKVVIVAMRALSSSGRNRLYSLSQDSLYGSDGIERRATLSGSSSNSDRASECSALEEDPPSSCDAFSDQSRTSSSSSSPGFHREANQVPVENPSGELAGNATRLNCCNDNWSRGEAPLPQIVERIKGGEKLPQNVFGFRRRREQLIHQKHVRLKKGVAEGLGMRIGGGLNSNEGDTPIYVANINPSGPAGKSRQVKKGDVVLFVNGHSLLGLTHNQAVTTLKATANQKEVVITLLEGPESSPGPANFIPSWLYWQKLPRSLHISKSVVLYRSPGASLGFSIVGGADPHRGPEPIHVLFVVATSPAALDGNLRCGDRILAVDGHSLENVAHTTAVALLKNSGQRVRLEIVSWLGTEL